tara:strand:+ start:11515 stop:12180 length:666 start_codon:yes stop_codon:yes gene_type:complete
MLSMLFFSCASENQQKGLGLVSDLYGAKTSYTKGFKINNGKKATIFTVKVGQSKALDTLPWPTASSNIALMIYENFSDEERENFTNIAVEKDEKEEDRRETQYFELGRLADAMEQANVFKKFSDYLMKENYEAIVDDVDSRYKNAQTLPNLKAYMNGLIAKHGKITGYNRMEYGILTPNSGGDKLFKYLGYLKFSDQSIWPYSVTASMDLSNKDILGYRLD